MPHPPRSMLFVSGEKAERFPKALSAGADLACIDLEDAVHPAHKAQARDAAFAFAASHKAATATSRLAIRCNGLRSSAGLADFAAWSTSTAYLDYLLVPKVEGAEDLVLVHAWVGDRFGALVALIETPLGIEQAASIAATARERAPKLVALMLGGADLSVELGAAFDWEGLSYARGRLVNAARSAGLDAWDMPHLNLNDPEGLIQETRAALRLGFSCKTAIHPSQLTLIHSAFRPDPADIEWAHALLQTHTDQEAIVGARGAFVFQGKMVDPPVLAKARRIVQLAGTT